MASSLQDTNVMQTVRGIYQNGRVKLLDKPVHVKQHATVLVTFITNERGVALKKRGISQDRAEDLRGRLKSFAGDWNLPEMDAYDAL